MVDSPYLAKHASEHFKIWFNKDKYDYKGIGTQYLALYCPNYIVYWFYPEKIDWSQKQVLIDNCSKFKNLFKLDLILYSLAKD